MPKKIDQNLLSMNEYGHKPKSSSNFFEITKKDQEISRTLYFIGKF